MITTIDKKYRLTIFTSEDRERILMVRTYRRIKDLQKDFGGISSKNLHKYLGGYEKGKGGKASRYFPILRYCKLEYINKPHGNFKSDAAYRKIKAVKAILSK